MIPKIRIFEGCLRSSFFSGLNLFQVNINLQRKRKRIRLRLTETFHGNVNLRRLRSTESLTNPLMLRNRLRAPQMHFFPQARAPVFKNAR